MARKQMNADSMEDAAEPLNGEDQEVTEEYRASNRAATIREACETIGELERQVAGLKAEIKVVKETRIKAELNMKVADFNLAYKLYQMEQGERDGLQDVIRECFAALGIGEQLNWVVAAETADAASA